MERSSIPERHLDPKALFDASYHMARYLAGEAGVGCSAPVPSSLAKATAAVVRCGSELYIWRGHWLQLIGE